MAEFALKPRSALLGTLQAGRIGRPDGEPGVILAESTGLSLFVILARRGQSDALAARAKALGLDLPAPSRRTEAGAMALVGTGPDQWLAICPATEAEAVRSRFAPLDELCTIVRIEDARTLLRISGPAARNALAKMLPIDLHPRAFRPGDSAMTTAGTIPVTLWLLDPAPVFEIAVPRSFAGSFWHWLTDSAAEYGCLVDDTSPA